MKLLYTLNNTQGSKKRARTDDSNGGGGSADRRGRGAADYADLRAHGYEVKLEVPVKFNSAVLELLFEVWQPFSTSYTSC
jgi:hypothetical protein